MTPSTLSRPLAFGLACLLGLACASCAKKGDDANSEGDESSKNQPPAHVELPDPPPASGLTIKKKNPDGTYRVRGLIAERGKKLGSEVEVKGMVTAISAPCDPAEAEKKGKKCYHPSIFIKDSPEAKRGLKLVGHTDEFIDRAGLEEGKTYVFKGEYRKIAQEFAASEYGLILLKSAGDTKVGEK